MDPRLRGDDESWTNRVGQTMLRGGWIYIMTNGPHGTLYIGVSAHLDQRIGQHKMGRGSDFCRKHGLTVLVFAERHEDIRDAIAREKAMKKWNRAWKSS